MRKESPPSFFPHTTHTLDSVIDLKEPCWKIMDALFRRLDNLRALHFSLPLVHPCFRGPGVVWVGRTRIAWCLQSLRNRENFTLSFSVEEEVVPCVVMPHTLPLELHLQVLRYVVTNDWEVEDRIRALSACCAACRTWYHFCKGKFHTAVLHTRRRLNKFRTSLSSSTSSIGIGVTKLTLAGNEHIFHFAPIYFARKLPSLQHLVIEGAQQPDPFEKTKQSDPFVPHDSLLMALGQFKTVTELSLSRLTFQSFWHFRRFIVALPELSHLRLSNVHLPDLDPFNQRVPSLYSTPQNLTNIFVKPSIAWNPLWLWTLPLHTLPRSTGNSHPHPFLTPSVGGIIAKLAKLERAWSRSDFNWMYTEEHQQCKFSNLDPSIL